MVKIRKENKTPTRPLSISLRQILCVVCIGICILLVHTLKHFDSSIQSDTRVVGSSPLQKADIVGEGQGVRRGGFVSHRAPLAYGTKSGKEKTAQLVKDAILTGFRHIVTGGHHSSHNESGVGYGWKLAVSQNTSIRRQDLFLQTCFVPWDGSDFEKETTDAEMFLQLQNNNRNNNQALPSTPTIEDQVHISIQTSLRNLQSEYIDAVVFHNFRATLHPYDQMMKAWRVLEEYVEKGIIHHLGMTSVHKAQHLEQLYKESTVKPTIIQNRFHSNRGYDVDMQKTFETYDVQVQRFWLLNGSSGGGRRNQDMANNKNVTPAQLMLAFVMSFGSHTCLVGTHSLQHMKDDILASKCYNTWFQDNDGNDDTERMEYAKKLGIKLPNDAKLSHEDDQTRASTKRQCTHYLLQLQKEQQ